MSKRIEYYARQDFKVFFRLAWEYLQLGEPTPVQYEMADFLQYGSKRSGIQAFRGAGKSWITSIFVLWKLYCNKHLKFLVVSANKGRADEFSTFTQRLILEWPLLARMRPSKNARWSKVKFDVAGVKADHAASVRSVGITGGITGARADHIIADDVEVPNNSCTEDLRDKLIGWCGEFSSVLKPEGDLAITYLGTPQTEDSIYTKLAEDKGYDFRVWPVMIPKYEEVEAYEVEGKDGIGGRDLAPTIKELALQGEYEGLSVEPTRFTIKDLKEREMDQGKSQFQLQFMLNTKMSDENRYPLKTRDLVIMPSLQGSAEGPGMVKYSSAPENQIRELPCLGLTGDRFFRPMALDQSRVPWVKWEGSVMFIDPSGRGEDETSYCVAKQLYGFIFITAVGGFTGGYSETTLLRLAKVARNEAVNEIIVEPNYGDGMFNELLKPMLEQINYRCTVSDAEWASVQKEKRIIDTLEPLMNRHKLIFDMSIVEKDVRLIKHERKYSLFHQMTRITHEKGSLAHDDKIEAIAGACNYWVQSMARNAEKAIESHREKEKIERLQRYMKIARRVHGSAFDRCKKGQYGKKASNVVGRRAWNRTQNY